MNLVERHKKGIRNVLTMGHCSCMHEISFVDFTLGSRTTSLFSSSLLIFGSASISSLFSMNVSVDTPRDSNSDLIASAVMDRTFCVINDSSCLDQ